MFLPLTAEIVTIGDELNRGEITDTNSAWIAERLTRLGCHVRWRSSVVDDDADMSAALAQAAKRARVVVVSGGLGPTEDDRTVDVACALLGVAPVEDALHRERMDARFRERGFTVTPNNLRQVRVPSGAVVLTNDAGLAPGFSVRLGQAEIFFTPGVPREMKAIFDTGIAPRVSALLEGAPATARRVWRVSGMGESHVAHRLRGVMDGIDDATLHFRIAYPENLVTVVARRASQADADAVINQLDIRMRERLGGAVYGINDETLPLLIGRALTARRETIATAESCTGGLIGDLLTDVAGSSAYFLGGVIAYSNDVKRAQLGVSEATLAAHGAVSAECVREMAAGVRARLGTTWGVAVSGIAGPDGGSPDKPVGLVHFAVAGPSGIEARQLSWKAERRQVKELAAHAALNLLHRLLDEKRAAMPEPIEAAARSGKRS